MLLLSILEVKNRVEYLNASGNKCQDFLED